MRRLGGRVGAELTGVDLSENLDARVVAEINAALLEHKALLFRGQRLDDAAQLRIASLFGEGQSDPRRVSSEEATRGRTSQWYGEASYLRSPPKVTTLRSLIVPPYGGNTLVASATAAYQALPLPLRRLAEQLWAVHVPDAHDEAAPGPWRAAHPVVRVHPETGERGLFIGSFARRVLGLSADESRDILRILQSYVTRPENVVRVGWAPGDLLVVDNRVTQRYTPADHGELPRLLHRVTVAGDVPAGIDGERSTLVEGDEATHQASAAVA
ncbi:TauD/TfdA dioxygenase family protein [Streptomyces sp. 4N509B]|uniref:TauD/TfdA dioxygenase family protein n=1 Tax=Streptomyces sp. 4N509B TaxID=3457413 RepID=UPI003FD64DA8